MAAEKETTVQIIPATGWYAIYGENHEQAKSYPVAVWELVKVTGFVTEDEEPFHIVRGLTAIQGSYALASANEEGPHEPFIGYEYRPND